MQRVQFLKSQSGYIDCRTLKHFKAGEVYEINDNLVKNFISTGSIQLIEDKAPVIEEKIANITIDNKVDKKVKKRRKKSL